MPRFMIELDKVTFDALCAFAAEERREPARQAEWILCQAMQSRVKQQVALRHLEGTHEAPVETEGNA